MSKVEKIIDEINASVSDDESQILEFDFDECFKLMREMEHAMTEFVNRVDKGEIRIIKTYIKFKKILDL